MSLRDRTLSELDSVFFGGGLGESLSYVPASGEPYDVRAYVDFNTDYPVPDRSISPQGTTPTQITMALADVRGGWVRGDKMVVRGVTYTINRPILDATGVARFVLHKG